MARHSGEPPTQMTGSCSPYERNDTELTRRVLAQVGRRTGHPRRERPKGRSLVIQGLSINGTWPAGLLVALVVVLLTIVAVRIGGHRAGRGNPGRGEPGRGGGRRQGADGSIDSRQVLEEMYARGELGSRDHQNRLRVLRRGA